ncbi:hypothetical protein CU669_17435 [Paramagnetospirillum kuznetsovii]|uniref:Uncharacterized protein n=1 Tax=Paramagnetospirillum kuznetsovii TaxID=2053833 RepID=A0A364NU71_9PROT|nr:hypothetical protein CU669_17435 [Paramagnetospirillum kuznetsovii]
MSGWGCVHEANGHCGKVVGRPCDPGMKGCVLAGRFRFSNPSKNRKAAPDKDQAADPEHRQTDGLPKSVG